MKLHIREPHDCRYRQTSVLVGKDVWNYILENPMTADIVKRQF